MAAEFLARIRLEDFDACVGRAFEVASEEDGAPFTQLTLFSAVELGGSVMPGGVAPFSLTFNGPVEIPLEQGTYWFSRPNFQPHEIFIVPIGEKENIRTYEAIFS